MTHDLVPVLVRFNQPFAMALEWWWISCGSTTFPILFPGASSLGPHSGSGQETNPQKSETPTAAERPSLLDVDVPSLLHILHSYQPAKQLETTLVQVGVRLHVMLCHTGDRTSRLRISSYNRVMLDIQCVQSGVVAIFVAMALRNSTNFGGTLKPRCWSTGIPVLDTSRVTQ